VQFYGNAVAKEETRDKAKTKDILTDLSFS
jgi:hypothetical protein